jgi:competence protein ComFC
VLEQIRSALEIVYPLSCGGCGSAGSVLCQECKDFFRPVEETSSCSFCGTWLSAENVCGECTRKRPPFERGHFGFYFEGALREAVHSFKFKGRKDVGRALVRLLRPKLLHMQEAFDVIVPLPVTEKRLKERGFNQTFIIAEEISAVTGKKLVHQALYKTRETRDQYTLSRPERKKNVRGVFALRDGNVLKGKHVLLVDDLFTTGATAKEATKVLQAAGSRSVVLFALARTP